MLSSRAPKPCPMLCISLNLLELQAAPENTELVQRAVVPVLSPPRTGTCLNEFVLLDPLYLSKCHILLRNQKAEIGGSFYSNTRKGGEDGGWLYHSHRKSDVSCSQNDDSTPSVSEPSLLQSSKRSILPWRKRKLSFRSPKVKGEPLLKKAYAEEGGDDIDFDRRQLSSDEAHALGSDSQLQLLLQWNKAEDDSSANRSSISEFGDDNFAVGSWEVKDVISCDGLMKRVGPNPPTNLDPTILRPKSMKPFQL